MRYLPKSDTERAEMLRSIGAESLEKLFAHLPPDVRLNRPLEIPAGKSEYEIVDYFRARGAECAEGYACERDGCSWCGAPSPGSRCTSGFDGAAQRSSRTGVQ